MWVPTEGDKAYLKCICFSDEAAFHVCGKDDRHNCSAGNGADDVLMKWFKMSAIHLNLMFGEESRSTKWAYHRCHTEAF